ncbi:hypothetical protein I5M27_11815 [Adhaeribacter sp. BT258]|uniref:Uncharacterized protein n=1 Tax=Adhaeribacter terrigena TaxID=2793070 RepID=A0ABS1C2P3_9BACT|nr:hypothetical protein [Adhaeribacter terrigena]MBK0403676.1 hypothetical protein [Adhaeribacter terrigena]
MPYKSNSTNKQSRSNLGNPAGKGTGTMKDAHIENFDDQYNELEARYTDDVDEPTIDTRLGSHPNRNTNKPNIDKPRYS